MSPEMEMKLTTMPVRNASPSPNAVELCRRLILDLNPCSKNESTPHTASQAAAKLCQAYADKTMDHALRACSISRLDKCRKSRTKIFFDGCSRIITACEASMSDQGGYGKKMLLTPVQDLPSLSECLVIVPNYGAGIDRGERDQTPARRAS